VRKRKTKFEKWFVTNRRDFEGLCQACKSIIEAVLREHKISFLSVNFRVKTLESALKKVREKNYRKPISEMTDLAGLRILTYTEADALKVSELIKTVFFVDPKNSKNKSDDLQRNKVGYRSHHFVCQLDKARQELIEFRRYKSLVFEIQVRTVLQHAWAEIEHSRNYKFGGVLPAHLERNLNLISGLLEVADNQIVQLAEAIDNYKRELEVKTKTGDLDLELTTVGLQAFGQSFGNTLKNAKIYRILRLDSYTNVIGELKRFGIRNIEGLNKLASAAFVKAFDEPLMRTTDIGLARDLMMFVDLRKYFEKAFRKGWSSTHPDTVRLLKHAYSALEIEKVLRENGIEIVDDEPPDDEPPDDEPPDDEPPDDEPPDDEPPPADEPPPDES
jgi:putative GTP pyrophosphokinase